VDIKIDDEVRELGGLYIIGTERHESRRIDNQLRGRAGRQGDPGVSRFYLSLEDNLLRIFGGDRIKSIMDRLGIKEGESIESRIVTRAVENAQKKVESLHFESRKHLLEYDDVANEQRKTIYRYRNELLDENYDIRAKISQNIKEYAQTTLNSMMEGENLGDFEALKQKIAQDFATEIDEVDFKELDLVALEEKLSEILERSYEGKMAQISSEQLRNIERILYLQVLDNAWREHLYQMDILKTGIGLRGYNQKDPLVEYKKESYNLFLELVERIKFDSIKLLFSVQISQKDAENLEEKANKENDELLESTAQIGASEDNLGEAEFKKVPRNAPCPCGSGKKFKECHGKSGPKRGVMADRA
ncbi:preprotein translocase subunit SecA, partial [Campylobacter helveticus]